jgi:cell division protein FtsZ
MPQRTSLTLLLLVVMYLLPRTSQHLRRLRPNSLSRRKRLHLDSPSAEALARLNAAVSNTPAREAQPAPTAAPAPQAPEAAERPRFGINSLIGRMTGGAEQSERSAPAAMRQQPPVQEAYDDEQSTNAEQDRIEIPAFLRRQAN